MMKCLSLWQPWATLMGIGAKRIETRSWPTNYRGLLAIHASKVWTDYLYNLCHTAPFHEALKAGGYMEPPEEDRTERRPRFLPLGCVVAVVRIYDCWRVERIEQAHNNATTEIDAQTAATLRWAGHSEEFIKEAIRPTLSPPERAFGDYGSGRWGWLTTDRKQLATPVPCVGRQGIFNLPPDVEAAVRAQIGVAA